MDGFSLGLPRKSVRENSPKQRERKREENMSTETQVKRKLLTIYSIKINKLTKMGNNSSIQSSNRQYK